MTYCEKSQSFEAGVGLFVLTDAEPDTSNCRMLSMTENLLQKEQNTKASKGKAVSHPTSYFASGGMNCSSQNTYAM